MADFPRITKDPSIMGGKACIRDTHVTVSAIVALLSSGRGKEDVIRMLPALVLEDLNEALAYAAWCIDEPEAAAATEFSTPLPVPSATGLPKTGPAAWPGLKILSQPTPSAPVTAPINSYSVITDSPMEEPVVNGASGHEQEHGPEDSAEASDMEVVDGDEGRSEPDANPAHPDESLELYHPAYPDMPTVVVTRHGLFDRRWSTNILAWSDIEEIERISGHKNINIVLRNPEHYLSSMPFLKRFCARIKLALNMQTFYLDTALLGVRTKDLYFTANRLWHMHRGKVRFRKKRRIRVGKRSSRDSYWQKTLPR